MSLQTSPSDKWLLDLESGSVMQVEPHDTYWYERKVHAEKGNYDVEELADNPDYDARIDMDMDDFKESDNG